MRNNSHFTNTARMIVSLAVALFASACQSVEQSPDRDAVAAMSKAGKAYFDEKCKTVAGEKIYRTVADVEGVLLMKVRPRASETESQDPMWPGAAFAIEAYEDSYITSFLGYEYAAGNINNAPAVVTPGKRGYITTDKRPGGLPGYRYVDVIDAKDGLRYRYTGSQKAVGKKDTTAYNVQVAMKADPNYDLNVYSYVLDRALVTTTAPRYGVTFEDRVVPEERAIGVASSTVKVVDLSTKEVLGEMIRYAWRPRGMRLTEWQTAYKCPGHAVGSEAATRKFVDQVLMPKGE